jgi:E3 ubiquitin-protein ligase RFWD2
MDSLTKFTRYTKMRSLATLRYGDMFNVSNIVSSIEFDKDDELFACAGVCDCPHHRTTRI